MPWALALIGPCPRMYVGSDQTRRVRLDVASRRWEYTCLMSTLELFLASSLSGTQLQQSAKPPTQKTSCFRRRRRSRSPGKT